MRILRFLLPCLLFIPAMGCVTAHFTPLTQYDRPARKMETVELLQSGYPTRPFEEVGLIQVDSSGGRDLAVRHLLEEGGARGCDAVALAGSTRDLGWIYLPHAGLVPYDKDHLLAGCLIWKPSDSTAAK